MDNNWGRKLGKNLFLDVCTYLEKFWPLKALVLGKN
jgi:hypothetical protein